VFILKGRRAVDLQDLRRYLDYVFETKSFQPTPSHGRVSEYALDASREIRGCGRGPALIIHGMLPRVGTVYVGELLSLHPDLDPYPRRIWEVPFLQLKDELLHVQEKFIYGYRHNAGKLGDQDFLPIFGGALLAYLQLETPADKRLLLKVPGVQHLDSFFTVFPHEHLLLLLRDGRDVVQSTVRTWPQLRFSFVCRRWKRAARMVLACHERFSHRAEGYWLARFEDAVREPEAFVMEACRRFGLDESRYPLGRIAEVAVRGSSSLSPPGDISWHPVDKPRDFRPAGRWIDWSAGKKRTFRRIAGQELVELGYSSDSDW
jgi:protein-tyrosine sulfotransferase